jgi:hypothetical protein
MPQFPVFSLFYLFNFFLFRTWLAMPLLKARVKDSTVCVAFCWQAMLNTVLGDGAGTKPSADAVTIYF